MTVGFCKRLSRDYVRQLRDRGLFLRKRAWDSRACPGNARPARKLLPWKCFLQSVSRSFYFYTLTINDSIFKKVILLHKHQRSNPETNTQWTCIDILERLLSALCKCQENACQNRATCYSGRTQLNLRRKWETGSFTWVDRLKNSPQYFHWRQAYRWQLRPPKSY